MAFSREETKSFLDSLIEVIDFYYTCDPEDLDNLVLKDGKLKISCYPYSPEGSCSPNVFGFELFYEEHMILTFDGNNVSVIDDDYTKRIFENLDSLTLIQFFVQNQLDTFKGKTNLFAILESIVKNN